MTKKTNKVAEVLNKTSTQIGRSSEQSKIDYAIKSA